MVINVARLLLALLLAALAGCATVTQPAVDVPTLAQLPTLTPAATVTDDTQPVTREAALNNTLVAIGATQTALAPISRLALAIPAFKLASSPTLLPYIAGKWQFSTTTDAFDDTVTSALFVAANEAVQSYFGETIALYLRCQGSQFAAFVNLYSPGSLYDDSTHVSARIRFDREAAQVIQMDRSDTGDGLFFESPALVLSTLVKHDTLTFGYATGDTAYTFDLRGLSEGLNRLTACGQ